MSVFGCHVPLIAALLDPGMRERHWAEFQAVSGINFRPSVELTLSKLLATYNLQPHIIKLQAIVDVAAKEAAVGLKR